MLVLLFFAFIGGIVTILSPCILPILPIVLSGSLTGGKKRPLGIVAGFIASFTFFTLFLTAIVKYFGFPADVLRTIAVLVVGFFGISLFIPQTQIFLERLFSQLSSRITPRRNTVVSGFWGGVLIGLSLGLVWTPCVGPIIAAIITLAATTTVTIDAILITLCYSFGTAIPLLLITYGGRQLLHKVPWLLKNTKRIQKVFGVLMLMTAFGIYFNIDRRFQAYILQKFPNYGVGLTALEDTPIVKNALDQFKNREVNSSETGKSRELLNFFKNDGYPAPGFSGGGTWINSEPLELENLRGKVVLVDFWTYTCINCIRTLPYLRDWHAKYKDQGFVLVGVHTPEFAFEQETKNVIQAAKDFSLTYPIVQDNEYKIWEAYDNHYWPAKYLIDGQGNVRYTHFGEGKYDETEEMIQKLLKESGKQVDIPVSNQEYTLQSRTPELYLGFNRIEFFDSSPAPKLKTPTLYGLNSMKPKKNHFGFVGEWMMGEEYSQPTKGSSLQLTFEAKDVYLVMRPLNGLSPKVRLRLDGLPVLPEQFAGIDVKGNQSEILLDTDRLYHLIRLETAGEHILTLEFINGNVEVFAFTFG